MQASGGPITKDQTGVETYAVIFTIAPSRQDVNTIWTGSDDGWVHVTRDGGKTWDRVTPPDLPEFTRISLIEASPHQNGVAYLAGNRYQLGDRTPVRLQDRRLRQDLDEDRQRHSRRRLRRAPSAKTRSAAACCIVGTEHGIYISFNDGASWQSLQLNLPVTPVHGIVVGRARPGDRHARPRLLRARRHQRAAAGDAATSRRARCTCSSRTIRCAASTATSPSTTTWARKRTR